MTQKCIWQHSMAHPRKPPYKRKNLAKIFYASRVIAHFVPNFVAMATGVGRGKMQLAAFDGPSPKTPYRCKNLADIFYTRRVIAHFVPNIVAVATGVGRGKMQLAALDSPSPKTPFRRKNLLYKPSYSPFCPKFCCHGNQGKGTGKENGEGKGKGKGKDKEKEKGKEKEKEKGKGKGMWKEDSLRNVGRTDGRTHGRTHEHKGDFILCPMLLCIALDRQQGKIKFEGRTFNQNMQLQIVTKPTVLYCHLAKYKRGERFRFYQINLVVVFS